MLPLQRVLNLRNIANLTRTFTVEVIATAPAITAAVEVDGLEVINFQLGPGGERALVVSLTGAVPAPGLYEGRIRITNDVGSPVLNVPYAFAVGDGIPYNTLAIAGDGLVGTVGEIHPELLIFKVVDQFGEPIANAPVDFFVSDGDGTIVFADGSTDSFGGATADTDMGPTIGFQDFGADVGPITVSFLNEGLPKPTIGGIVNGASFAVGAPVAPGSIASVFGTELSEFLGVASTLPLPIALKHVSFSFDFPEMGLSVPAPFFFSSSGQLNIQVPWEFLGLNFAIVKARIGDRVSETFVLNLQDAAPGIFEFDLSGEKFAVATHVDGSLVTEANPALQGETVVLYGTGFGPVDQPQATGEAALAAPLARTVRTPIASIGSFGGQVTFSGLAPGFVGLNQLNVRIAEGTPSSKQSIVFLTYGVSTNTSLIWIE